MTRKKSKGCNDFDQAHFIKLTKRRFKKRFKKNITATQINKIWKDFVQHGIIQNVLKGNCTKIDKHSSIRVIGVRVEDDERFVRLLKEGKMLNQNGTIKKAGFRGMRSDFKYSIVYENKLAKSKIIFKACPSFRKQLIDTLNNTNTYFPIVSQNCDNILNK